MSSGIRNGGGQRGTTRIGAKVVKDRGGECLADVTAEPRSSLPFPLGCERDSVVRLRAPPAPAARQGRRGAARASTGTSPVPAASHQGCRSGHVVEGRRALEICLAGPTSAVASSRLRNGPRSRRAACRRAVAARRTRLPSPAVTAPGRSASSSRPPRGRPGRRSGWRWRAARRVRPAPRCARRP